jgi:hypothetical protein
LIDLKHVPMVFDASVPELSTIRYKSAVGTREDAMDGSSVNGPISVVLGVFGLPEHLLPQRGWSASESVSF